MTTQRETKEFTTTGGHVVKVKTYASGREFNEIQNIYLASAKVNMIGKEVVVDSFDPTAESRANEKMLSLLVVSVDGVMEDVANIILDLPNDETQEIIKLVSELTGKKK